MSISHVDLFASTIGGYVHGLARIRPPVHPGTRLRVGHQGVQLLRRLRDADRAGFNEGTMRRV